MKKIKVSVKNPNGEIREEKGELVEIIDMKEPWAEYKLKDGTVIRTRHIIGSVIKSDEKDERGLPVYIVDSYPTASVINCFPE